MTHPGDHHHCAGVGCFCRADTIESLRAKLAEAGARAEHEHAEMQRQAKLAVDWMIDAQRALAACAEMRAALEAIDRECLGYTTWAFEARAAVEKCRALLSRTDLGRGMVVVPREVVERVRGAVAHGQTAEQRVNLLADLDALLKKGGG